MARVSTVNMIVSVGSLYSLNVVPELYAYLTLLLVLDASVYYMNKIFEFIVYNFVKICHNN